MNPGAYDPRPGAKLSSPQQPAAENRSPTPGGGGQRPSVTHYTHISYYLGNFPFFIPFLYPFPPFLFNYYNNNKENNIC